MYSQLENYAINIRKSIIEMITNSKSGHPGGSLSSVEILTYLYFKEMNINEENLKKDTNTVKRKKSKGVKNV